MSTWKNTDITRKLMCANEHSDAKCELTLNDDGKHIKAQMKTTKDTIDKDSHDLAMTCYIVKHILHVKPSAHDIQICWKP